MEQSVLLTGGLGFIGSHTAVEMLNLGYDVVIADNLYNSDASVVDAIEKITGVRPAFYKCDVTEKTAVEKIFEEKNIEAVIHFAGYKAVGESVEKPLMYYRNNLDSTLTVLECMKAHGVNTIIFSSSATVYGENNKVPFVETMPTSCTNPYGWTKLISEEILRDSGIADENFSVVLLRYFNPVGAHPSGYIGENPKGIPNNLMPFIQQVASGKRERLTVFGNDYDTPDGTGVRDYIHVVDLAKGHVAALNYALNNKGTEIFNLGTGKGTSVLELVKAFEKVNGIGIAHVIGDRRPGDIAECYADVSKAERVLSWKAELRIEDMCRDSWKWEQDNIHLRCNV